MMLSPAVRIKVSRIYISVVNEDLSCVMRPHNVPLAVQSVKRITKANQEVTVSDVE